MWSVEDTIISLAYDRLPKWKLANYVNLEKPHNRYKREEFAEIISKAATTNLELLSILEHARAQRLAHEELHRLYMKDHNTSPPIYRPDGKRNDWVLRLQEYKQT